MFFKKFSLSNADIYSKPSQYVRIKGFMRFHNVASPMFEYNTGTLEISFNKFYHQIIICAWE